MTDIEISMRTILAELMGISPQQISTTATFFELGMDSFIGLRFAKKINELLDIEIELEWVFDYPTIQQLAQFLETHPHRQASV